MIFTKFKRFIAVLLCVVVLASFSLSAFASLSTLQYENINTIQESFIGSFLSHCGIEVEFFDLDIDYRTDEFYDAAFFNLTRSFANYVFKQDSKFESNILDYARSSGLDSNIHGSSFVWQGNFKESSELVSQLVSHLYNFLSNYENMYGYCDVPISMYVGDYADKFTGVWSRVTFLGLGHDIDTWYNNVGKSIQDYCTGDYVEDDFEGCLINYYWDYGPLPLGHQLYLDVLENYMDDYKSSSGDSSDTSSDTSSDSSSSSDSYDSELIDFSKKYYPSLFLGIISTFGITIRHDTPGMSYDDIEGQYLLTDIKDCILTPLYEIIMGDKYSYYVDTYYPSIKDDFLLVCNEYMDRHHYNTSYSFYPYSDDFSRRFTLGLFELFKYEVLDSPYFDKELNEDLQGWVYLRLGYQFIFTFSTVVPCTYSYWLEVNYPIIIKYLVLSSNTIAPIVIHSNLSNYLDVWYLKHDTFFSDYIDPDVAKLDLYLYDGYNIKHLLDKLVFSSIDVQLSLFQYIDGFFSGSSAVFVFLSSLFACFPLSLQSLFIGGFILLLSFLFVKSLL